MSWQASLKFPPFAFVFVPPSFGTGQSFFFGSIDDSVSSSPLFLICRSLELRPTGFPRPSFLQDQPHPIRVFPFFHLRNHAKKEMILVSVLLPQSRCLLSHKLLAVCRVAEHFATLTFISQGFFCLLFFGLTFYEVLKSFAIFLLLPFPLRISGNS